MSPEHAIESEDLRDDDVTGQLAALAFEDLGFEFIDTVHFEPADVTLPGCGGMSDVPPSCNTGCVSSTVAVLFDGAPPNEESLLGSVAIQAKDMTCQLAVNASDPGPDSGNVFVDIARETSPIFAAESLVAGRALPLMARGDSFYDPAGMERLTEKFAALGAVVPDPPHDIGPECGHVDYLDPGKPHCGFDLVVEELETAFLMGPELSGTWYDPAQSGHGFLVQMLSSSKALVYWFVYDPFGNPLWLFEVGTVDGKTIEVPLKRTFGTGFPPDFNAADVEVEPWGTLTLAFEDCQSGSASWTSDNPDYEDGQMPLVRLSGIDGLSCAEADQ